MVKGKRGWLRIFEAILGVMILAGAILFFYERSLETRDSSDYIYQLQSSILDELELNSTLRLAVLGSNHAIVNDVATKKIPSTFDFEIKICDIQDELSCKKTNYVEKQVYVLDKIIASNLTLYSPKKVRLFIWSK